MIPFEKQLGEPADRRCGAAALCMVYRSFGLECSQEEVWEKVSRKEPNGRIGARTHTLAQDANNRGLSALVIEARHPWRILTACHRRNIRVVINHRPGREATVGHYSVLSSIEEDRLFLHDPGFGPDRPWSRDVFLNLWKPRGPRCEIAGNILVAVAGPKEHGNGANCEACQRPLPEMGSKIECRVCRQPIPLQPSGALGCVAADCTMQLWRRLFCPYCDASVREIAPESLVIDRA